MASQKVRLTVLQRFFRTLKCQMYAFVPEKPPGLVGRDFCLAILWVFANALMVGVVGIFRLGQTADAVKITLFVCKLRPDFYPAALTQRPERLY